jgi:threonylcarbamoyladenosine tRNA methylthiotransferase MtaB
MAKGRLAIVTLGCKVNQCESEAIAGVLEQEGWEVVPFGPDVDGAVVNTCVVTARAQADSRRWICRARRVIPRGLLLVTGCFPQIDPQGVAGLGADGIIGNQEKARMAEIVEAVRRGKGPVIEVGAIAQAGQLADLQGKRFSRRTRAFLKIQDGCNARCSYCIVPVARGRSRSLPAIDVLAALKRLRTEGYEEAVLAGIHLGAYGQDLDAKSTLLELLGRIEAAETPGRVRLSSLEPPEAIPELIAFISSSRKICPHFHLPMQSGSDEILKRMNRPYSRAFFRDLVYDIIEKMPQAAIGVDVIAGFPGEDEQAFGQTYDLLRELPVSYLHCFPFSPRPGTPAATMTGQVGERTKKKRVERMRRLSREKRQAFYSRFIGEPLMLLIEHRRVHGMLRGISRNYIFCLLEGEEELMGREVEATLLEVQGERAMGGRVRSCAVSYNAAQRGTDDSRHHKADA